MKLHPHSLRAEVLSVLENVGYNNVLPWELEEGMSFVRATLYTRANSNVYNMTNHTHTFQNGIDSAYFFSLIEHGSTRLF